LTGRTKSNREKVIKKKAYTAGTGGGFEGEYMYSTGTSGHLEDPDGDDGDDWL
jgi:hypothetical protein